MEEFLSKTYLEGVSQEGLFTSYLSEKNDYHTDKGIKDEGCIPVLLGDDDILSEITIPDNPNVAYQKASSFIRIFTSVFIEEKTPERAYSKFIQNMNELPDVELDWIFQYFRVSFLFSLSDDDFFCITKYDKNTQMYESKTGPLEKSKYKDVAEIVLQEVG